MNVGNRVMYLGSNSDLFGKVGTVTLLNPQWICPVEVTFPDGEVYYSLIAHVKVITELTYLAKIC